MENICLRVAFATKPLVEQKRNPHSYLADFDAEQDLYYKSGKLIEFLAEWSPKESGIQEQIVELYGLLYERDYVGMEDVRMVKLWLIELERAGYAFPKPCDK